MSEQEKIDLREKISNGLKQSYENLLRHKAALGLDIITADKNGQPVSIPASELIDTEKRALHQ